MRRVLKRCNLEYRLNFALSKSEDEKFHWNRESFVKNGLSFDCFKPKNLA